MDVRVLQSIDILIRIVSNVLITPGIADSSRGICIGGTSPMRLCRFMYIVSLAYIYDYSSVRGRKFISKL